MSAVAGCSTCVSGRDFIHFGATLNVVAVDTNPASRAIESRMHLLGAMDGLRNAMTNDFTAAFAYVHQRWGTVFMRKDTSLIIRACEEIE
ncbi:hypothetical protein [Bradyrhizobium tropiciagri]|uniref:hypothetical protein n=1 Tax=Bradyrhizobium tropiciagri TaxID=312253 RepID=UPI001009A74C|nr:hypothetical protein [Bradyrhizobium tropiciagri]